MMRMIIAAMAGFLLMGASSPIIIAHRGASGTVPEHTLAAYAKAIDEGADFIEPDLVMTKDKVLVIRHENEISGTTDVAAHPEFAARKTTKTIDGESITGWFTEDFTLAELKTLRARERLPLLRPDSAKLDGRYEIATFDEAIALVKAAKRRVGLYPETKHPGYFANIGLCFDKPLIKALKNAGYTKASDPVFIQSFEVGNLKRLRKITRLRLVQLMADEGGPPDVKGATYADMATPAGLTAIAAYANGVGVAKAMIVPLGADGNWKAPTTLVTDAHAAGLKVHVWTFRAENAFLPPALRTGTNPAARGDIASEIKRFTALGIDGIFSDHPAQAVAAARPLRQARLASGLNCWHGVIMIADHAHAPFIMLDDARGTGASPARLYTSPLRVIEAVSAQQVAGALDEVAAASRNGLHVAGFLSYEAGHALEPRLADQQRKGGVPLLWFGVFDRYQKIAPEKVAALLPDPAGAYAAVPTPSRSRADYDAAFAAVQAYIEAGDIYQANLTLPFTVPFAGHPLALYAGLRARAKAGYGGVIWTGTDWLLSLSPELFFAARGGKVTTKPMKGTAARGPDDAAIVEALRTDPKQRAENLMIVDLLRNDLSRIAVAGSVETPQLFHVETYPTVHQMTSTVTATMRDGLGAVDVLRAIFPCGSITGAPKIRAMEVIGEIEPHPRGAYTGSIGRIDANGDAAFNVAIRTLHIAGEANSATLGLGGGIVADSVCASEWAEVHAKGAFVADRRQIDLIETMRFDPASGIALLDRHIARLGNSAAALGFALDRHGARNELQAATFRISRPRKVRLMLSKSGRIAIEISALPPTPDAPVAVALASHGVAQVDFRLSHKTSDRAFYTAARGPHFEVALVDAHGFLTEGSFTSLFVKRDGKLLTPPLSRGCLPGVLRAELIDRDMAVEADLRAEDLRDGFFIGNACRGLLAAKLA